MNSYSVDVVVTYKGEEYRMLQDLDIEGYELILAVKTRDLENEKYPAKTYIIPSI